MIRHDKAAVQYQWISDAVTDIHANFVDTF